ncbi:MAG: type II/IV secretion system protein [Magnetococcales bacterium]|nr:type II/IV secretion system protein [Magnetococcales bacterium]
MPTSPDDSDATRPVAEAPSDQRLREHPRYQALREHLAAHDLVEPRLLAKLLGYPITDEEIGLVQFLTQTQLISQEELKTAKENKRSQPDISLADAIIQAGALGETGLAMAMAVVSRLPYFAFQPANADAMTLKRLDVRTANAWRAFPARFHGDAILLAAADPRRIDLEEAATFMDHPIRMAVAPARTIRQAIEMWYGDEKLRRDDALIGELDLRTVQSPEKGVPAISGSDATTLINRILLTAARMNASDVHLVPDERFLRVDFRLDGKIHSQAQLPLNLANHIISRIKVLSGLDISEKRLPQDGAIRTRLPDRSMDIRVSVIPAIRGEAVVLRLLDLQVGIVKLEALGFFPADQERLRRAASLPHGLILLTGPTGSGKSTTLRAALHFIQGTENRHILTVEDPVEVKMEGITQVRVHDKIDYTFARALRHFLRHDPDVIMVGEIRDGETARIAVQAALTGHLVLSTLHTNDAPGAVARLLDMGAEPYLVSSAVTLVIGQRLARRLCRVCRRSAQPTSQEQKLLQSMGHSGQPVTGHFLPTGCPQCNHTGYQGRTVLYEMMPIDDELRGMIARRESASVLRAAATTKGYRPLIASGIQKVLDGTISLTEAATYLDLIP